MAHRHRKRDGKCETGWRGTLLLNVLAAAVYLAIVAQLGFPASLSHTLTATPDASSYLAAGKMLLGSDPAFSLYDPLRYRPFLFPLIFETLYGLHPVLFWAFHFLCWLFVINGIFILARRVTGQMTAAFLAAAVGMTNFGLIGLTMHGLTEVLTTALLTATLLTHLSGMQNQGKLRLLLFLTSLLTVVRPVFAPLLLLLVILSFRKVPVRGKLRHLAFILLSVSPLLLQIGLMYHWYGTPFISEIGSATLRNHLAAQVAMATHGLTLPEARQLIWDKDAGELALFLIDNLQVTLGIYARNVVECLWNYSYYVNYPVYHNLLTRATLLWNQGMSVTLVLALLFLVVRWLRDRRRPTDVVILPAFISLLIIGTAGISFGEADRLTVTALPSNLILILLAVRSLAGDRWRHSARGKPEASLREDPGYM